MISEVEKDLWGLAFKIVTKRLVTRRKTPGLDNPDRVKYIVRSLLPHVKPFQRQDRSSYVVRRDEIFTLEELKRADSQRGDRGIPGDPPGGISMARNKKYLFSVIFFYTPSNTPKI